MPVHWTYQTFDPQSDLEQGDIIAPSDEVRALLSGYGSFGDDGHIAFILATQSCDLVRRGGSPPKASHLAVAGIKPLAPALPTLLAATVKAVAPGRFKASSMAEARRLLERVFNQNEQALGIFFLFEESEIGIGEPSVAMLRRTAAVSCDDYEVLRKARTGRLTPEFRAKLGWLLGNLYDRPATPDWSDMPGGPAKYESLVRDYLREQVPGFGPAWIDDEIVAAAKNIGVDIAMAPVHELELLKPLPAHEQAIEEVCKQIRKIDAAFDDEKLGKLHNRLANSGQFKRLFRKAGLV